MGTKLDFIADPNNKHHLPLFPYAKGEAIAKKLKLQSYVETSALVCMHSNNHLIE